MERQAQQESEESTLNRLLGAEPNSVLGHVSLGDLRAREGKDNLARYFYRRALALAECQSLPAEAMAKVRRAEAELAALEQRAYEEREAKLVERGFPPDEWSPRFRQALETAAERRGDGVQEPTDFDFPGLPAIQFFSAADFAWTARVEAATSAIREELERELERGTGHFRAYVQSHTVSPDANAALLAKQDWSVLSLCENGWMAPRVVERFPRTWEAVLHAPAPRIYGWGPTIVFSLLKGGAHIPAHNGMFNTRLICHLPLIVPPGCRFRIGNEVREWEEGKLLIFDDTVEHEAWNDSSEDRIVLIFDIWRPELTEREKEELTALFHP